MSGCDEIREILVEVARGEPVSAAGQRFLREHVDGCPMCRTRLANERMLSAGLRSMGSVPVPSPPLALGDALLHEFRRWRGAVPIRKRSRRQAVVQWMVIPAAAAVVLMGVFWTNGRRPHKLVAPALTPHNMAAISAPPAVVPDVTPAAPASSSGSRNAGMPKGHGTRRPSRRVEPAPQPAAPDIASPEIATDFLEIPYAEPLRPEERVDVFRVQMPRARMAAFGLPVSGGRLDSRITADVLMGEDGVIRAVRFIR